MGPEFQPAPTVYLLGKRLAISHTFILREVKRLRTTNFDRALVSVARAQGDDS